MVKNGSEILVDVLVELVRPCAELLADGARQREKGVEGVVLPGMGPSQILCKLQMRHEQSRIIHCARQRIYPTAALCAV